MSALASLLARDASQPERKLCVVTCCDPEVANAVALALGSGEPRVVLALPGPAVRPGSDELARSVAAALMLQECEEVLVVAHSGCSLGTQAGTVAGRLSACGFDRARLPEDVRTFFNLQASPRQIAVETAAAIRSAPFMPAGLRVHAALLDDGTLTLLEHGDNAATAAPSPSSGLFGESETRSLDGPLPEGLGVGLPQSVAFEPGPVSLDVQLSPAPAFAAPLFEIQPTVLPTSEIDLRPSPVRITPSLPDLRPTQLEASLQGLTALSAAPPPLPTVAREPAQPARPPAARAQRRPPPATSRPPQATSRPPRPPPRKQAAGSSSGAEPARLPPALLPALEKVREFYRAEIEVAVRAEVGRSLREGFASGCANAELIKVAFRPVLESGPKRYKVIDELLAIKEASSGLDRDGCYAALRQFVE